LPQRDRQLRDMVIEFLTFSRMIQPTRSSRPARSRPRRVTAVCFSAPGSLR
jgi:hypothetical protein